MRSLLQWMIRPRHVLWVCVLWILSGCATQTQEVKKARKPIVPKTLYPKVVRNEGSLWPGESPYNTLANDAKAKRVGDIVTIIVEEELDSTQSATTSTDKESAIELETGRLLGLPSNLGIQNFFGSGNGFDPNIDATVSRSNQGNGTTTREGELTGRISAMVTEVFPNGNMKIQARRDMMINNEKQFLLLSGIIRPVDINFDNTISSTQIADAEIVYSGRGVIADEQRVGWAYRLLGWVWPF